MVKRSKICIIEVFKREEREYIAEYEDTELFFPKDGKIHQAADSRTPSIIKTRK